MGEFALPKAKFDRKGRVVCPVCGDSGEVPRDSWLSVGQMVCGGGHAFFITAHVAAAVNDILSKTREGDWRRDVVKNIELPVVTAHREEGGKVVLPKPPEEDEP